MENVLKLETPQDAPASAQSLKLDPRTYERGLSCVHCGLCLPACPTYTQNGLEADSPRGRIQLMLGLSDGAIRPTESVRRHLDLCLDCRACETACPSGVVYHELIEESRSRLLPTARPDLQSRLMRWLFFHLLTRPTRLKIALFPARLLQKLGIYGLLRRIGIFKLLPEKLRKMERMLPAQGRLWPVGLKARSPAEGPKKTTVAFFGGCIGSVMFDDVNRKAVELLTAAGAEVVVPTGQVCCGAIHHHNGAHGPAEALARKNIKALRPSANSSFEFLVTTIAGCGAMLREYDFLLRDDAVYRAEAGQFAARVRDVTEVLAAIGLPAMNHPTQTTAAYHDACHLAHAQKVTAAPRQLLKAIPGLKLVPLAENDMCCGAAGTYNLTEPEMANALARRKVNHIIATGAHVCITGNVGCAMQIQSEADSRGARLRVLHPVEILHQAVFGPEK